MKSKMIEAFGFVFTVLAALWVRKQDIERFLAENQSREQLISGIILPDSKFRFLIQRLLNFLDRTFEHGMKFFFSIFMLSLLYVSISFVFSLNFIESKNLFFKGEMFVEDARTAFLVFLISMPLTWVLGSSHNRHLRSLYKPGKNLKNINSRLRRLNNRLPHRCYYVLSAFVLTISTELVYQSRVLTVFTLIISTISTLFPLYLSPFYLMTKRYFQVAAGAALGTLGLLLATFSFASATMSNVDYFFIVTLTAASAILALFSLIASVSVSDQLYKDFWRLIPKSSKVLHVFASLIGRPSLFVGFHCTRASGPFCAAVSVILLNVAVARTMVPEAVVCAGSIMLACIVFFSGATTLAGAGFFAFGVVVLIGAYMATSPDLLFSVWASPFLLWILLPLVNSVIDYYRWVITRNNMSDYVNRSGVSHARALFFDMFFALAGFVIYVFLTFVALSLFDRFAVNLGYGLPFDLREINEGIKTDLFHQGIWLLVMAGTMLIPTVIQFGLFLYSGLIFLYTRRYRYRLVREVRAAQTKYEFDSVAWRVSALDVMGRGVLAVVLVTIIAYIGAHLMPLFERITGLACDYGIALGNMVASWVFANS